jgi:hypothetical protein
MARPNVVSLDEGIRLTRANTIRSSAYFAKAQHLTAHLRHQLALAEQLLFAARNSLEECVIGELQKLEACFECAHGKIFYYFSFPQRKFVLLDFDLNFNGTGGLPSSTPSGGDSDKACTQSNDNDKDFETRHEAAYFSLSKIIALVSSLDFTNLFRLLQPVRNSASLASAYIEHFVRDNLSASGVFVGGHHYASLLQSLDEHNRARRNLARWSASLEHEFDHASLVPSWSILAPFVVTSEQLDNEYARSVLFGEKLCHVVVGTGFGKSLLGQQSLRANELRRDVQLVLNAIFSEKPAPSLPAAFIATGSVGDPLLSDDLRLCLVSYELTAHLSVFVARSTYTARLIPKQDAVDLAWTMKRFALLTDFASLLQSLFRTGQPNLDIEAVYRNALVHHLRKDSLSEINALARLLSKELHERDQKRWSDECDLATLHEQLVRVTSDLFEETD